MITNRYAISAYHCFTSGRVEGRDPGDYFRRIPGSLTVQAGAYEKQEKPLICSSLNFLSPSGKRKFYRLNVQKVHQQESFSTQVHKKEYV